MIIELTPMSTQWRGQLLSSVQAHLLSYLHNFIYIRMTNPHNPTSPQTKRDLPVGEEQEDQKKPREDTKPTSTPAKS